MKITLPSRGSVNGAVARLLLAEARDPGKTLYNAAESMKSMQWMKLVLQNRLDNNPGQFSARHAKTLIDIMKAPEQFQGFSGYPHYNSDLADRLQSIINIAKATNDKRAAKYRMFVQNAITVAEAPVVSDPAKAADPRSLGLCGWRPVGAGSGSPRFVKYQDLAGNTFYSLNAE